jgi:hypothetical protein
MSSYEHGNGETQLEQSSINDKQEIVNFSQVSQKSQPSVPKAIDLSKDINPSPIALLFEKQRNHHEKQLIAETQIIKQSVEVRNIRKRHRELEKIDNTGSILKSDLFTLDSMEGDFTLSQFDCFVDQDAKYQTASIMSLESPSSVAYSDTSSTVFVYPSSPNDQFGDVQFCEKNTALDGKDCDIFNNVDKNVGCFIATQPDSAQLQSFYHTPDQTKPSKTYPDLQVLPIEQHELTNGMAPFSVTSKRSVSPLSKPITRLPNPPSIYIDDDDDELWDLMI